MIRIDLPKKVKRVRPPRDGDEHLGGDVSATDSGDILTDLSPNSLYAQSAGAWPISTMLPRSIQRSLSSPEVFADTTGRTGNQHQAFQEEYRERTRAGFASNDADQLRRYHSRYHPPGEREGNFDQGTGMDVTNDINSIQRDHTRVSYHQSGFKARKHGYSPQTEQFVPHPPNRSNTNTSRDSSMHNDNDRIGKAISFRFGDSKGEGGSYGQHRVDGIHESRITYTINGTQPSSPSFVHRTSISPRTSTASRDSPTTGTGSAIPNGGEETYFPSHEYRTSGRSVVTGNGEKYDSTRHHGNNNKYTEQDKNSIDRGVPNPHRGPRGNLTQEIRGQVAKKHYNSSGTSDADDLWSIDSRAATPSSMESITAKPETETLSGSLIANDNGDNDITQTNIDLRRSLIRGKQANKQPKNPNRYRFDVRVWQDGLSKVGYPPRLNNRRLMLDTQCEDSNWVSMRIVNELGASTRKLEQHAQFITFNGATMTSNLETTLSFADMDHGAARSASFLVAVDGKVPFDMVLGASDIEEFSILGPPVFGLRHDRQREEDLKEEKEREADQERKRQEQEKKNLQRKAEKDKKSKNDRNGQSSDPKRKDRKDSGFERGH